MKWADGRPFGADHVVVRFEFVPNGEASATTARTYLPLERVVAIDTTTVRMTL